MVVIFALTKVINCFTVSLRDNEAWLPHYTTAV